jgi:hypothetical protein
VQVDDLGDGLRFRLLKPKLGHGGLEAMVWRSGDQTK